MMLGQVAVTEYLVLVIMIVVIAFLAVILIFGFEMFSVGTTQITGTERRSLFLLQSFISLPALADLQHQKGSVFDDSKLTAATCEGLEDMLGEDWYAEIGVVMDRSHCEGLVPWKRTVCLRDVAELEGTVCTEGNYPGCGRWVYCEKMDRMMYRSLPVNVHRKINGTMELASLTLGIPAGG